MRLPETFLYGATISAHQVEGEDFESDWWRWEQRPSRIRDGETSERCAGHFTRYRADLQLARKLGHNAVCISLSWPRIHPAADTFDVKVLEHYRDVLRQVQECGMTPVCVLHQVTQPHWFSVKGGWCAADSASIFQGYVRQVVQALGDCCQRWVPVYEPEFWLTQVYRERRWPDGETDRHRAYHKALATLAVAQRLAASAIHECCPDAQVGISVRGTVVTPLDPHSPWDTRMARREQHRLNLRFIEAATSAKDGDDQFMDFVLLGFAGAMQVRFAPLYLRGGCALPLDRCETPANNAEGLDEILALFASMNKPILLTFHGSTFEDDAHRCLFLRDHFEALLRNVQHYEEGLQVQALFYDSLLDGFEWQHGYTHRCGLVHVKHPMLERTPNPSAWFFKDIAEHGCIREGTAKKFCKEQQQDR